MYLQEATVATNKSEKTLKRYIKKGELKWRRMGKQTNSPIQVWVTADIIASVGGDVEQKVDDPDIFDADSQQLDSLPDSEPDADLIHSQEAPSEEAVYERMIKTMVAEFTSHMEREREMLFELRRELQVKETQLRLLPDLQKQLEEKELLAHVEKLALEKQVEALKVSMENQKTVVEKLQSDNERRARIAEELQQENERLRAETQKPTTKRSWLGWFLGRPGGQ